MPIPEADMGMLGHWDVMRDTGRNPTVCVNGLKRRIISSSLLYPYIYYYYYYISFFSPFSALVSLAPLASLAPLNLKRRVSY